MVRHVRSHSRPFNIIAFQAADITRCRVSLIEPFTPEWQPRRTRHVSPHTFKCPTERHPPRRVTAKPHPLGARNRGEL
jgi:hypothetical protein